MGDLLKSKWVWIAMGVAILVGAYAFVGFKLAPGIVRKQATQFVRATYKRELRLGAIRINPFKLTFEARDIALPDRDGQPMLGLQRLFIDFEVSSLWHRAYVFREVQIEAPYLRPVLRPDGSMNLADLAVPPDPKAPKQPAAIPAVWIGALAVSQGKIDYVDQANRRTPLQMQFAPVEFTLQDFRTTPQGGGFHLAATGYGGAEFEWKGRFSLAPAVSSDGDFSISNLSVPRVADLVGDALPFTVSKGTLQLGGSYHVRLADIFDLQLHVPTVAFKDVGLRARGVDSDWIEIPDLKLEGIDVVLPVQSLSVASVALTGLKASGWLNPDGTLSLQQLFAPPVAAAPVPKPKPAPATTKTVSPAANNAWKVRVGTIDVNAALELEDRMIAPGTPWKFAPVNLHVKDATLDLARPVQFSLDSVVNDQASVHLSGSVALDPMVADVDVALQKARMRILQPYILPYADLTISDGTVGVTGKVHLAPPGKRPQLSFTGDVSIDGFKSTDNTLHEDFIGFSRLQLQKLHYEMSPDKVAIDRILVREPYARVIISREEIINISAVLDPKAAAAEAQQKRATAAALATETKAQKRQREKQAAAARKATAQARKKNGPTAPVAPAAAPADKMPVRIREVLVQRGRMDFSDLSVQPNFMANIQNLNGTVTGLSSAFASRATVDLKGNVGEFEPVTIAGTLQPFAFDRFTDIGLKFENISLPLFNPYSGRFAGYAIAKGKLTTDLHYLIQDRKLDARHHIEIDQLEWGEATPTKGEATLPVRFATSLLKDKDGLIKLDIPVTGSLDDPKLRIGPIVWQIFKNLIVKAVAAPFKLFGAMFKGAEDAQYVDFAPASPEIDAGGVERLHALGKGLAQRPNVSLDVPIAASAELDRPVLAQQHYAEQLSAATRVTVGKGKGADAPVPALETLEPKQQIEVLTALLRQQGVAAQVPAPPAPPEGTSRADARALRDAAIIEYLQKAARDAVAVKDDELAALGQARAVSIQHALLTDTGLEPTRVFLTREGKVSTQDGKVRFELGLK